MTGCLARTAFSRILKSSKPPLVLLLAGLLATVPAISPAEAQLGLGIPGWKTLKRKLGINKRSHKKQHSITRTDPGTGNDTTAKPDDNGSSLDQTAADLLPPPLPVRNPRKIPKTVAVVIRGPKNNSSNTWRHIPRPHLQSRDETATSAKTHQIQANTETRPQRNRTTLPSARTIAPKPKQKDRFREDVTPGKQLTADKAKSQARLERYEEPISPSDNLPPLPTRRPHRHPSEIETNIWSDELVSKASAECQILLASAQVTVQPLPPIHSGSCGAPAPQLLRTVATSTKVELSPPATLSCQMIANLERWLREDVQPLARKYMGSEVKQLRNVSSYVCRNRYGDTTTKISEHAYANALDVSSFVLADGRTIAVLGGWTDETDKRSEFLKALHTSACARFGTVLGPEANAAHKDHFHLDMAPRKHSNYCR